MERSGVGYTYCMHKYAAGTGRADLQQPKKALALSAIMYFLF